MIEAKTVYFEKPGGDNTEAALNLAKQRADALGIKTVVIASTRGNTAVRAMDVFKNMKVIVVGWSTGFREPNVQPFTEENRKIVLSKGGTVLTATHVFAGLSRATLTKHNTPGTGDLIADVLRIFGMGTKVSCEISMMAADAGLVRTDEEIIAVGGTGRGADTALVLNPVNAQNFFDLKIKEVVCKPRL